MNASQKLEALAAELDKKIETLPDWVQSLVKRRMFTARLLALHSQLESERRQIERVRLPSLLQKQAG